MVVKRLLKRRKLKAEFVKRYKPPKKGERLREIDLYPTTGNAFKRVSQIYGIPLKELTPFVAGKMKGWGFLAQGVYSQDTHRIRSAALGPCLLIDHESWHALQNLLKKSKGKMEPDEQLERLFKKKWTGVKDVKKAVRLLRQGAKRNRALLEPTAFVDHPVIAQFGAALQIRELALFAGILIHPAFYALFTGSAITQGARNFIAKGFYKRHGIDGMLLIFAYPPKKCDVLRLRAHEKKLVQEGYLKKQGGMTKKGIQLLRTLVPRETIIERAKGKEPKPKNR